MLFKKEKTKDDALALKEAACKATERLSRVVQERDALSKLQNEMIHDEEKKEIETTNSIKAYENEISQLNSAIKKLNDKIIQVTRDKRKANEKCNNVQQSLDDIISQSKNRETQLNSHLQQVKNDFNIAIKERDEHQNNLQDLHKKVSDLIQNENQLISDHNTTKITLEATISKLEQVTEELGRRIQSETVLSKEMVELRAELQDAKEKCQIMTEKYQKENDESIGEYNKLEKALIKRYV
jgi:chromosome segregation ATPase